MSKLLSRATERVALLALMWSFSLAVPVAADEIPVSLNDIEFHPDHIKASVGDTIRFTNSDVFDHDVYVVRTANRNDVIIPATTIHAGESVTVTIPAEGLFSLYCTIHGGMRGMISTGDSFELTAEEQARAAAMHVLPPIVKQGEELFWSRAECFHCHRIGDRGDGTRGPDLADVGFRAKVRAQRLGLSSATDYLVQSVMQPSAYLVEGYTNDMATVYQPPIDLDAQDLTAIVTYLQSQGGEVDTWGISIDAALLDSEPVLNPFAGGDAERGSEVFESMKCFSCHVIGDRKSITAGPELTDIGDYRHWAWLAESIIDPNAEVGSEWHQATLWRKSGGVLTGFVRRQGSDGVDLLTRPGVIETVPADDVDELRVTKLSKMPTNYGELLSVKQMSDLIAYLQSLGQQPHATAGSPAGADEDAEAEDDEDDADG